MNGAMWGEIHGPSFVEKRVMSVHTKHAIYSLAKPAEERDTVELWSAEFKGDCEGYNKAAKALYERYMKILDTPKRRGSMEEWLSLLLDAIRLSRQDPVDENQRTSFTSLSPVMVLNPIAPLHCLLKDHCIQKDSSGMLGPGIFLNPFCQGKLRRPLDGMNPSISLRPERKYADCF